MSTCKECKYFEKHKQAVGFGTQPGYGNCHLNPPNNTFRMGRTTSEYKTVHENDWCGSFKPAKVEEQIESNEQKNETIE